MHQNRICDLLRILPAPVAPMDCDESMLWRNQSALQIEFPPDYVEFGRIYGSGTISAAYSWEVWSPFRITLPLIVLQFARIWNIFKDAAEITDVPFGIFPEEGGILPFALTANGDWVCWRTRGAPDEWDVVDMGEYKNGAYEVLEMGFSEYFLAVLNRDVVLERHRDGDIWNPKTDLSFDQELFMDANLL